MTPRPIVVQNVSKTYGSVRALQRVSFSLPEGVIFALLGPNGAGKTTLIRILMGILPADEGQVLVLGTSPIEARPYVGYLPEARGLYRQARVLELLSYLGALKGLSLAEARREALAWLDRLGLAEWARRHVDELSHGMQQKVQLIAALLHRPRLIVFDEPFQGLDPVNVQLVKDLLRELRSQGHTILLSSHQLHHVEALADHVALIHRGRIVEEGPLAEVKARYRKGDVRVHVAGNVPLPSTLPGVRAVQQENGGWRLIPEGHQAPWELLASLTQMGLPVERFEVVEPTLEDIFLQAVETVQQEAR